ncbi:uncharacterized protein LOC126581548 [Anopheles aquasalis]|uniref:uncharacterized protein LOC126581548 n=1 Tax=Anopheles aquasalis TaxID=42839 RepID=UPI00215B1705|nr:uncharacterized protein LOC126581548 [Anopheles aquasalis]
METRSPNIVAGEASETDDDEIEPITIEKGIPHISPLHIVNASDPMFAREAVESSTPASEEEQQRMHARHAMNERCIGLLNEFIRNSVVAVAKTKLNDADNILMKSQMVLQNTMTSVKKISENTHHMECKMQDILTFNFVPNINI